MADETPQKSGASVEDIDRWTRHLWHMSQHNRMVIGLGGRIQSLVNEMRETVGLPEFGWNDAFPDADFGECTVHVGGCPGQESHG
jgi:hypothetical protein